MQNYIFEFDSKQLPQNFSKFAKLDLKKDIEDKNNFKLNNFEISPDTNKYYLNKYKSIVIERKNNDFIELELGGMHVRINSKYVYFLFFPIYHNCFLNFKSIDDYENYNIYIPYINEHLEEIETLKEIIQDYKIYFNKNINFEPQQYDCDRLMIAGGMIGSITNFKNYTKINEDEFYYELKQYEKKNDSYNKIEFQEKIFILDKYIQNDILKIYKQNFI